MVFSITLFSSRSKRTRTGGVIFTKVIVIVGGVLGKVERETWPSYRFRSASCF